MFPWVRWQKDMFRICWQNNVWLVGQEYIFFGGSHIRKHYYLFICLQELDIFKKIRRCGITGDLYQVTVLVSIMRKTIPHRKLQKTWNDKNNTIQTKTLTAWFMYEIKNQTQIR